MSYPIEGWAAYERWLATSPPEETRRAVLEWLMALAEDPGQFPAVRVRVALGLPASAAVVPGTDVGVTYTVVPSPPYEEAKIVLVRVQDRP